MVRCLPSHVQKPLTNYVKKKELYHKQYYDKDFL